MKVDLLHLLRGEERPHFMVLPLHTLPLSPLKHLPPCLLCARFLPGCGPAPPPSRTSQPSCFKTLTWHRDLNDLPVRRLRFNPLQRNAICRRTCGDSTVHRLCARGHARLPCFTATSDRFKWVVELCFEKRQGSKNMVRDFSSGTAEGCATLISYLDLKPFVTLAGADSQTSKREWPNNQR